MGKGLADGVQPFQCEAITFIWKTRPVKEKYNLHGTTLETVTSDKYLGVHISCKLTWNDHTDITTKKASQTLYFAEAAQPISMSSVTKHYLRT